MSQEETSRIEKVFKGTIIHSLGWDAELPDGGFQILQNALLGVNTKGRIAFIGDASHEDDLAQTFHFTKHQVIDLGKRFLIPGFVDTHIHAPQYAFAGTGNDLELLDWLNRYTFPTENKFQDVEFARRVYTKAVQRSLFSGTTTACYFATIHLSPTMTLVDVIGKLGQRALVGKVCMDRNSPDFYRETTDDSIKTSQQFVDHVLKVNNPLIKPVITPRFVPTCSGELMKGLADIAHNHNLPIQSHVSENKGEIAWVKELHPDISSYTEVYDKFGLLTSQTLLAHAVHLSDHELNLFKERNAGICHCPVSNFSLNSGILDARRVLDSEVKLGLGTDVSGGYSSSILEVIRQSVTASKSIQMQHPNPSQYKVLNFKEAFSLATLGGSQVLSLQDKIGNFVPGKDFDALIVNPFAEGSPFDVFEIDNFEDIFQKFIFLGDDRNIEEIFVAGKTIFHPDSAEALHRKKRKAEVEVTASPTISRVKPAAKATTEEPSSLWASSVFPLTLIGLSAVAIVGLKLFLQRKAQW